jgi:multiple sugar transport system permease protein
MNTKRKLAKFTNHAIVIFVGIFMFYPVLWLLSASFKDTVEIVTLSFNIIPETFVLYNFPNGWRGFGGITFATFFQNSMIVSTLATIGVTITSACVAYGFARIKFPGRKFWFACMMMTMMLPEQIILIPQYIIFHRFGWINTFLPLIVPSYFARAFFVFMIMQFISGLPKELDEAAIIDGCNKFTIFTRITLPLVWPALVTTIIINFYWKWDEFLQPLLYLSRPQRFTVSLALKAFVDSSSVTDFGALFAMSVLSLLPVFFIFLFFNRYLIQGISTTGLKG